MTADEYINFELAFFPKYRFFSDEEEIETPETRTNNRTFFPELDELNDGLDRIDKELDSILFKGGN